MIDIQAVTIYELIWNRASLTFLGDDPLYNNNKKNQTLTKQTKIPKKKKKTQKQQIGTTDVAKTHHDLECHRFAFVFNSQ